MKLIDCLKVFANHEYANRIIMIDGQAEAEENKEDQDSWAEACPLAELIEALETGVADEDVNQLQCEIHDKKIYAIVEDELVEPALLTAQICTDEEIQTLQKERQLRMEQEE